jgi:hypothetical protein
MKPTNQLLHFHNGGNSPDKPKGGHAVLGLPIFTDDNGHEFVIYNGKWTHIEDMTLPRLHRETVVPHKPARVPVSSSIPNLGAPPKRIDNPVPVQQITGGMGNLPPAFIKQSDGTYVKNPDAKF